MEGVTLGAVPQAGMQQRRWPAQSSYYLVCPHTCPPAPRHRPCPHPVPPGPAGKGMPMTLAWPVRLPFWVTAAPTRRPAHGTRLCKPDAEVTASHTRADLALPSWATALLPPPDQHCRQPTPSPNVLGPQKPPVG